MSQFKNILVAVDVLAEGEIPESTQQAIEQARWLAGQGDTQLTFVSVLKASEKVQEQMLSETPSKAREHYTLIEQKLAELCSSSEGKSSQKILFGKDWLELIREVITGGHDLVMMGIRNRNFAARALFGSTGMKLLRKCPSPVWITKPRKRPQLDSIFVAHDLSEVGSRALHLGATLAQASSARLHVFHALEHPEFESFLPNLEGDILLERHQAAEQQIRGELAEFTLTHTPQLTIENGTPYVEIINYLNAHPVDLVVMGTVARSGLAGILTGNTAENLLSWIPCSVLTLKPEGFVSPITPA